MTWSGIRTEFLERFYIIQFELTAFHNMKYVDSLFYLGPLYVKPDMENVIGVNWLWYLPSEE